MAKANSRRLLDARPANLAASDIPTNYCGQVASSRGAKSISRILPWRSSAKVMPCRQRALFLAEPSVETFDESILHGFAGLDEVLPHLRFQRPRLHGPRLKLRSVGARGRPPGRKLPTLPLFCGEPRSEPEIERADSQQQYAGNGRCAPVAGPGPRQEQRNTDHGAERRHRKG